MNSLINYVFGSDKQTFKLQDNFYYQNRVSNYHKMNTFFKAHSTRLDT